jgi:hypothetical protein
MFVPSAADVFRSRQAVSDLSHQITTASPQVLARIARHGRSTGSADLLRHAAGAGVFEMPRDEDMIAAVLLAAALPDEDFRGFTVATALLLLDRLQNGGGKDDLYWNWDAFADHYRLAPDVVRAALMNGFRALIVARGLYLSNPPTEWDCLTETDFDPELTLTAEEAGRMWTERTSRTEPLTGRERRIYRHLVERDESIAPDQPQTCPTVPPSTA